MEEAAFVLVMLVSLRYAAGHRLSAALFAAGVSAVLRPEGLLWTASLIIGIGLCEQSLRRVIRPFAWFLIPTVPWAVFSLSYFGSVVPQSVLAKHVAIGPGLFQTVSGFTGAYVDGLPNVYRHLLLAIILVFLLLAIRPRLSVIPVLFVGLYVAFFFVGRGEVFPWYLAPPVVMSGLATATGYERLHNLVEFGTTGSSRRPPPDSVARLCFALAGTAAGLGLILPIPHALTTAQREQTYEDTVRSPTGTWIKACTAPSATVMLEPIGYIGYMSQRAVIDLGGLVTPRIAHERQRNVTNWPWKEIDGARPDVIVLRSYELPADAFYANDNKPWLTKETRLEWDREYRLAITVGTGSTSLAVYIRAQVTTYCA